jgi:hypothetical protein
VNTPRFLFADGAINVTGRSRLSHLVLKSANSISVSQNASLEDCILVSPKITITGQADVAGQLFADSLIVVDGEAHLSDMALVYLIGHRLNDEWTGVVRIDSRRTADACLVFHGNPSARDLTSGQTKQTGRIQIAPGGTVNGVIWAEGYLEMLGTLKGSAVVNLLYHYESPTLYLNWLIDAWLEQPENAQTHVLPLVFGQHPVLEFKKFGPGV